MPIRKTSHLGQRRAGFSLVEIIIAVILLGIVGGGLVMTMARNNDRTIEAQERQTALTLAKGQVEKIRTAGPLTYKTPGETFQVDAEARRVSTGIYRVRIARKVLCAGGAITEDTPKSLLDWSCTAQKPVVTYQVDVTYPSRTKKRSTGQVTAAAAVNQVGMSVSFGDNDLTGQSCSGGKAWDPNANACVCPGGQTFDAAANSGIGACVCPTGQAWDGITCRASTCPGPFSRFENREDCQSNQIGSSDWRSDKSGTWCQTSPQGTWGAYYETNRSCACPVNIPDWNGALCICINASAPLSRAPACVGQGGQIQATPDTRTFNPANCSLSDWTVGTCTCPVPQIYIAPGQCGCANRPMAAADTVQATPCDARGLSPQISTSNQTRTFNYSTCEYSAVGADWGGGSCGCTNSGEPLAQDPTCPGAQSVTAQQTRTYSGTTSSPYCAYSGWTAGSCACANAGEALARASEGPCPGAQTPGGTQERTFDNTACTYSGWTGGTCACLNAGQPLSQATPDSYCPAAQYGTGTQTRTFDGTGCSYSGWNGGSCADRCSLPQVWGGSSCVCPNAGEALTQSYTGPCAGGEFPSGNQTRTFNNATCTYSGWSGGSCVSSCAAGTTWNGSICACNNAGESLSQGTPQSYCDATYPGGGTQAAGTQTRSFSGPDACSYSGWSGGNCVCPSGTSWNGSSCVNCNWTEYRTQSCAAGFNGSFDEQRVYTCPSNVGPWTLTASRCCPTGQSWNGSICVTDCSPSSEYSSDTCVALGRGDAGNVNYQRDYTCPGASWSAWYETSNSCSCSGYEERLDPCPAAYQTGNVIMRRDKLANCSGWSGWSQVGSTCSGAPPTATITSNGSFWTEEQTRFVMTWTEGTTGPQVVGYVLDGGTYGYAESTTLRIIYPGPGSYTVTGYVITSDWQTYAAAPLTVGISDATYVWEIENVQGGGFSNLIWDVVLYKFTSVTTEMDRVLIYQSSGRRLCADNGNPTPVNLNGVTRGCGSEMTVGSNWMAYDTMEGGAWVGDPSGTPLFVETQGAYNPYVFRSRGRIKTWAIKARSWIGPTYAF